MVWRTMIFKFYLMITENISEEFILYFVLCGTFNTTKTKKNVLLRSKDSRLGHHCSIQFVWINATNEYHFLYRVDFRVFHLFCIWYVASSACLVRLSLDRCKEMCDGWIIEVHATDALIIRRWRNIWWEKNFWWFSICICVNKYFSFLCKSHQSMYGLCLVCW